jgi:hypothetical protein
VLTEETRDEQRPSDLDGGAADAAGLEQPALPPCDRDEEHRELLELPHPRPLGRVVAPRAGPSIPRAEMLLPGAEAEEEDHDRSVGGDPRCSVRRGPPPRHSPRIRAQPESASAKRSSALRRGRPVVEAEVAGSRPLVSRRSVGRIRARERSGCAGQPATTRQPEFGPLRAVYPDSATAHPRLFRRVHVPGICVGEADGRVKARTKKPQSGLKHVELDPTCTRSPLPCR